MSLLFLFVLPLFAACSLCQQNVIAEADPARERQVISLKPLGYQLPGNSSATEAAPADGVFFIDQDHLLLTARYFGVLRRVAGSLPQDDDRAIRASVIEVPSGKLVASAVWRLHDRGAFLWQLAGGKFLLRIRNELFMTDSTLQMRPLLRSGAPIRTVDASWDGRTIVLQTVLERHSPETHQKLAEKAKHAGLEPPAEDVRVLVVRPETGTVVAEARERLPTTVALIGDGFVEALPQRSGHWELRYVSFKGDARVIGTFVSRCDVTVRTLNQDTLLLGACLGTEGARGAIAVSMQGKTLWTVPPRRDLVMPRFWVSAGGGEVVLSRLMRDTPAESWNAYVHDNEIVGQRVDVMDVKTGALRLTERASPSLGNGHTSALSPDGGRFAVLKSGSLEITDLQASPYSVFRGGFDDDDRSSPDNTPFTNYHQFRPRNVSLSQAGLDLTTESPELLALAPAPIVVPHDVETGKGPSAASASVTDTTAAQARPAVDPQTVIHVNTRLVLVDVVVSDRGKPVRGLEKKQFHILENGREQSISSFEESQTNEAIQKASPAPQDVNTYTNVPSGESSGPLNIILLDSLNTPITEQSEVHQQVLQYMQHLRPGAPYAIFALNRRLEMVSGITSDPGLLVRALQSKAARPQMSVAMDNGFAASLRSSGDTAAANAPNPGVGAQIQANAYNDAADVAASANSSQTQLTLSALGQLGRYLTNIPGRKNLIWFSGSFPIEAFPEFTGSQPVGNSAKQTFSTTSGTDGTMQSRNDSESGGLIRDMARLLQSARIAVYPVYALGLSTTMSLSAQYNLGDRRIQGANDLDFQANDVQSAKQDTLRMLAAESGGEYSNSNGFKQLLQKAVNNGSHYYTIGYVPGDRKFDGGLRSIKVKLDKGGYTLAYRHSFFSEPAKPASRQSPRAVAALQQAATPGSPPSTQIAFQTRILPGTDPIFKEGHLEPGPAGEMAAQLKGPLHRYVVDLAVNPHDVTFQTDSDAEYSGELACLLVAYTDAGKRVNSVQQDLRLHLPLNQYKRLLDANIVHRMELDLPSGHYAFHIVIFDPATTHIGSLDAPIDVPAS